MQRINGGKSHMKFSTHEPLFRQGHVGDLRAKSRVEIVELLDRQEKLLADRNFISQLRDRGAKIERFASSLRARLQEIEDNSQRNAIDTCDSSTDLQSADEEPIENVSSNEDILENNLSILEKGFANLAIHEGPHYEVVKKASEKKKQSKFFLNRVKEKGQVEDTKLQKNVESSETRIVSSTSELSAASIRNPKTTTQLISIEESRTLFNKQQAIVKEQQSQLTAERILSKYASGEPAEAALGSDRQLLVEKDAFSHSSEEDEQEGISHLVDDLDELD